MERKMIPYEWVGRRVELWTITGAPGTATDFGQMIDVTELGIVIRAPARGTESGTDAFFPWGAVYRIALVPE